MTSVGSILGGAFGLVGRHPLAVLVWGLLHLAAFAALLFAMQPLFQIYGELFAQQFAAGPGKPLDPQALQPYMARFQAAGGIVFLAQIGMFALLMVLFTASQRAILRPWQRGFFFLRLGGDELRLMALGFVLVVCLYFGMFIAMLVVGIVVAIVAVASGSPAAIGTLLAIALIVLTGGMIYAQVRISLAFPLSFVRRDFIIGEAWRLSRGRFWTLFGAYFVLALLYFVLASLVFGFALAPLFSELAQSPNSPDAIRAAFQHELELVTGFTGIGAALWLGFGLLSGLSIALFGGAVATAARDLLAGDPALAEPPRG